MYGFDEWAGSGSWACVGLLDTALDGVEVARSVWEVPAKGKSGIVDMVVIKQLGAASCY
jgi:hypothetical protein